MNPIPLNKPVLIRWEDIIDLPNGWLDYDEAIDHEHVHATPQFTVEQHGVIIANEEDYILVSSAIFQDKSTLSHVTRIPKGAIKEIVELVEKK